MSPTGNGLGGMGGVGGGVAFAHGRVYPEPCTPNPNPKTSHLNLTPQTPNLKVWLSDNFLDLNGADSGSAPRPLNPEPCTLNPEP